MGRGRGAKRRGDAQVYDNLYMPFMNGGRASNNQTNNRQIVLQRMHRRVLGELAMNRFEWKGFEGTGVNVRFLEMMLYFHALAVVFKDDPKYVPDAREPGGMKLARMGTGQIYALRGAASGPRNLVDDPTAFTVTGSNFTGRVLTHNECVPIWANYFRSPDLDIVEVYSQKLAEVDRTIEINMMNARRSKVMAYNENGQLTAKNINDMIDRGEATIPVNMQLGDMVTALDLGVDPKGIEVLSVIRARLWNEAMGMLGINNSNQDKKERLVSAEVGANDDQVGSARRVNLNARQDAANAINEMFGLDVSVDYYQNQPVETVNPLTVEQTSPESGGA